MNNAITINTQFNTDEIRQELRDSDDIRGNVHEHIMNLRDQGVREALEKLGWTPPGEESVQNQLCARIDELERDKEVLATQVDRLEEQLAILRSQADALHLIGSTLDFDPGTDLTREAPARVEALVAHVKGLKPAVEAFANGLGYCCCGEPMDIHSFGCGHSPVDQGWYALDQYMGEAFDNSLALHDANLLGDLAMRWDREGDAQLESGCSGIEHQGRSRKYAACLAANESNRIRKGAQGGEL